MSIMKKDTCFYDWLPIICYMAVWLISYGAFFVFCPGGEMAYWMLVFWIVMPLAAVITACKLGQKRRWPMIWAILFSLFYGVMYMLIRYVTFGHHGAGLEWHLMFIGAIFFLAGFVTGRGMMKK